MVGIDPAPTGWPGRARSGIATTADGVEGLARPARVRGRRDRLRRHLGRRPPAQRRGRPRARQARMVDLTPAAHRPVRRPAGQPRRDTSTPTTSTWSPAAARRPSRSSPRSAGSRRCLRRDRRLHRVALGRTRHPRQHRRVHRDHRPRPSRRSAAPSRARRSSC